MIERGEGAAVEQAGFHIREGAFHLPFRLGPAGPAGYRSEAVVGGERQEPRIVDRHVVFVAGHDDLHIVIQAGGRHSPQVLEGPQVLAQGGRHVLVLDEAKVLPSRVAQDVAEQTDAAPALAGEVEVVHGIIHLSLGSGARLEADHRDRRPSGT